jgi:hypothetical protein
MGAVIDVVVAAVFGGATGAFFLCAWHLFSSSPSRLDGEICGGRRFYFIMNGF